MGRNAFARENKNLSQVELKIFIRHQSGDLRWEAEYESRHLMSQVWTKKMNLEIVSRH